MVFNTVTASHEEVNSYSEAISLREEKVNQYLLTCQQIFTISQVTYNDDGTQTWAGLDLSNTFFTLTTSGVTDTPILFKPKEPQSNT